MQLNTAYLINVLSKRPKLLVNNKYDHYLKLFPEYNLFIKNNLINCVNIDMEIMQPKNLKSWM